MILAGDIFMNLEELFTLKNLNEAFYEASKENKWKETTQRYQQNLLLNNMKLREEILSGSYRVSHTTDFKINERGKNEADPRTGHAGQDIPESLNKEALDTSDKTTSYLR